MILARIKRAMAMAGGGVHRRVFRTKRGYVGLAMGGICKGDSIALFRGASVPFVLRHADICACAGGSDVGPVPGRVTEPSVFRRGGDGSLGGTTGASVEGERDVKMVRKCMFKIVCEAYVCGMMDGFSPADAKDTILVW